MNRENLHLAILVELQENQSRWGFPEKSLRIRVRVNHACDCDDKQWEAGLIYLEEAGFIRIEGKELNPENRCWKIKKEGTDYLASRGHL